MVAFQALNVDVLSITKLPVDKAGSFFNFSIL